MAKKKRKNITAARKGVWIPWYVPKTVFEGGLVNEFDLWRTIKCTCGPSFTVIPKGFRRKDMDRLVELGWIRWDALSRRWYQKPTKEVFPFYANTQKVWHPAHWCAKDCAPVLYNIAVSYLKRVQDPAGTTIRGRRRKVRRLSALNRRSPHLGGVAHSIVTKFLGISTGYSSKLRRGCEANGLCMFTERFRLTAYDCAFHGNVICGDGRHLFDGYCGPWARLASQHVPSPVEVVEFSTCKAMRGTGVKRDLRLVSNFVTGGAYAM